MTIDQLTQTPRKYGLHATVKPPFRLADGMSFEALAMDAFRFHMTVTGKMPSKQAEEALKIPKPIVDPILPGPLPINSLSLMGEDASGMSHEIQRFPLASLGRDTKGRHPN